MRRAVKGLWAVGREHPDFSFNCESCNLYADLGELYADLREGLMVQAREFEPLRGLNGQNEGFLIHIPALGNYIRGCKAEACYVLWCFHGF
jgi:hypothetical protein